MPGRGERFGQLRSVPGSELLTVLLHDRRRRFQPDPDPAALVNVRTFDGNPPNNVLCGQNRCHNAATSGYKGFNGPDMVPKSPVLRLMIPEKDIWRAAVLMLKRYRDGALAESATRADQLDQEGDPEGAATWRWIARAIEQLVNTKPPGPVH
jgi:hypothetical protein